MSTTYSRELMEKMLHEQEQGMPIAGICEKLGINEKKWYYWRQKYYDGDVAKPKKEKRKYKKRTFKVVKPKDKKYPSEDIFGFMEDMQKQGYTASLFFEENMLTIQLEKEEKDNE